MLLPDLAPLLLAGSHEHTNFLAVPASVVAAFVLGGLWYSLLFRKPWLARMGHDPSKPMGNPLKAMSIHIVLLGMTAIGMYFLAQQVELFNWMEGALLGLAIGVAFVGTSIGTIYAYQARGFVLWLIDASYQILCLVIMGAIMGAWHG